MYINLTQIHIYSDTKKTCNIGIIQKNVLQAIWDSMHQQPDNKSILSYLKQLQWQIKLQWKLKLKYVEKVSADDMAIDTSTDIELQNYYILLVSLSGWQVYIFISYSK